MSLASNTAFVDTVLAQMRANHDYSATDYFNSIGKRSIEVKNRVKPKNVTPAMPKPFCRHKEFLKMP